MIVVAAVFVVHGGGDNADVFVDVDIDVVVDVAPDMIS